MSVRRFCLAALAGWCLIAVATATGAARQAAPPVNPQYYLATWTGISGDRFYKNAPGADFTTFTDAWVNANIRGKGPLGALYPVPCCIHEGDQV